MKKKSRPLWISASRCTFKSSNDLSQMILYCFVVLYFSLFMININGIISYLIEKGTRRCSQAGKHLKIYYIGYWDSGSESRYLSVHKTQLMLLRSKGHEEVQQRTKAGKSRQCLWVCSRGAVGKKHWGLIQKHYSPNFTQSLPQIWICPSFACPSFRKSM